MKTRKYDAVKAYLCQKLIIAHKYEQKNACFADAVQSSKKECGSALLGTNAAVASGLFHQSAEYGAPLTVSGVSMWINDRHFTDLAEQEGRSAKTIQRVLRHATVSSAPRAPRPLVIVADATYFSRGDGVLIGKDPHRSEVVYRAEIQTETALAYGKMRHELEWRGYTLLAVVIDGKRGIAEVFHDVPLQLCQFHQMQIVRRKLTLRPKTQAGVELLNIGLHVTRCSVNT